MTRYREGDRVRHVSGRVGTIVRLYDVRGAGGAPVEYAEIKVDGRGDDHEKHPTIVLTKIR